MIEEQELLTLLADMESFRVERTISTTDTTKFCEAICAFSNDMPGARLPGFLFIGADDKTGAPSGLTVSDKLLQTLAGLGTDGNILPAPALSAYKLTLSSGTGDIAVVEVQPSDIPPVRYKGQVRIRRGPRKGIANESEERILAERRTAGHVTFDAQACAGSTLADLVLDLFTTGYRPLAVDAEVISENARAVEIQLATLRFFDLAKNCPTHAGVLLFGKNPLYHEPNAYLTYVRYDGADQGADVLADRQFSGDLLTMLRDLDGFTKSLPVARPVEESALREKLVCDYPPVALRELLMNAVMHRAYDQPSFIRILHFHDRIEILSPGPLYGLANASNFPRQTSYRNPVIAEAMKVLGFVNRFGRGVERAQAALKDNGSPPAEFEFGDTFFGVTVRACR
ncbi:MAG: putative DNA binding domain-containing protein [Gemmataceae bacterium]|nr:putative DNA binding domain-containing protein [Gemmataceae bacterium]